jgi:hypothetical protein
MIKNIFMITKFYIQQLQSIQKENMHKFTLYLIKINLKIT